MEETIVSSRPDREIRKKIIKPGDYSLVPYEDSRCKIAIHNVSSKNGAGDHLIEAGSRIFSSAFDGIILIGDCDFYIDKDIELLVQQMCSGESCKASIVYKDNEGKVANDISFTIELLDVMEEQLISDWGSERLFEASLHHKERGVELVREQRITDAFRRFSKSLKFLIAIEPVDPEVIDEERMTEMVDLKVKLYNNLAHCQLQYDEFEAAIELCNKALKYDANNMKALYRRSCGYTGLNLYEEAWIDIQKVLELDPNDTAAQQKAIALRQKIKKIKTDYTNIIKKMFGFYDVNKTKSDSKSFNGGLQVPIVLQEIDWQKLKYDERLRNHPNKLTNSQLTARNTKRLKRSHMLSN